MSCMKSAHWHRGTIGIATTGLVVAGLLAACTSSPSKSGPERASGGVTGSYLVPAGIHKIKHVIVIMQENRSFDSYFGTYPGVDGIPMKNGVPTACVPNPKGPCVRPYHDTAGDVDGGKMDGFIKERDSAKKTCTDFADPACQRGAKTPDVMGYHTGAE